MGGVARPVVSNDGIFAESDAHAGDLDVSVKPFDLVKSIPSQPCLAYAGRRADCRLGGIARGSSTGP